MATALRIKDIAGAFPEGFAWPSREQLEDGLRQARRVVKDARHTAEDAVEDASVAIRHHPLMAVSVAAAAGLLLGASCVGVAAAVRRFRRGPCWD